MTGRIVWSTTSDLVGRKNMYRFYLGVGALLYLTVLLTTNSSPALFLICAMLILSFYGGGFATVPAYLRDLFGTYQVGAIHGRLLTAWSVAGVLGPLIVNAIADAQIAAKVAGPARYTTSFIIMIVLLVIGFVCNELIKPVADRFHEERSTATTDGSAGMTTQDKPASSTLLIGIVAWLWVLIPLAYGLYQLVIKIPALFAG